MPKYASKGLNLIEIMVVISIAAILTVISVPMYTSYTTKSKFAEIYASVNQYRGELQAAYSNSDQFPSTLSNLSASTYTNISSSTLQQIYYGLSTNKQSAYLLLYTQNLGVPNFVMANSSGSGGTAGRMAFAAVVVSAGPTRFYCGQWDGSNADVPLGYLPANCQDTNISALIS